MSIFNLSFKSSYSISVRKIWELIFLISDLSIFWLNIGIVKVKPIVAFVFSEPSSILEASEYSVDAVISSEGLFELFSIDKSIFLILILFLAINKLKLFS